MSPIPPGLTSKLNLFTSHERYRWTQLPYGVWFCEDGREVLFNRLYLAMWERRNGIAKPADQSEWVTHVRSGWFYSDKDASQRAPFIHRLHDVLTAFQDGADISGYLVTRA